MKKFSVSALLWVVSACAVLIFVFTAQRTIQEKQNRISQLNDEFEACRLRWGEFVESDENEYRIKYFRDRYVGSAGSREDRWRIHVPRLSRCRVYYADGELPDSGVPERGQPMLTSYLDHEESADLVLVIECGIGIVNSTKQFCVTLYPEIASEKYSAHNSYMNSDAKWLPVGKPSRQREHPSKRESTTFSPEEKPFVVMKDYFVNEDGQKVGYMIWMEHDPQED